MTTNTHTGPVFLISEYPLLLCWQLSFRGDKPYLNSGHKQSLLLPNISGIQYKIYQRLPGQGTKSMSRNMSSMAFLDLPVRPTISGFQDEVVRTAMMDPVGSFRRKHLLDCNFAYYSTASYRERLQPLTYRWER